MKKSQTCPSCKSTNTCPIFYGYPADIEAYLEGEAKGEFIGGGCVIKKTVLLGTVRIVQTDGGLLMLTETQIRKLLEDIKTAYLVGYFKDDLNGEAVKWGQIQVLEWILSK